MLPITFYLYLTSVMKLKKIRTKNGNETFEDVSDIFYN